MAKIVRYNGDNVSVYSCSSPIGLVTGKKYEVVLERDCGYQTNFMLKGVEGEFNSIWFDEVENTDNVVMGVAGIIPVVNREFNYSQINIIDHEVFYFDKVMHCVKAVYYLGNNVYMVMDAEILAYIFVG